MQQEIEAKFLRQDHNTIRDSLRKLGATCEVPMKLVRRTVFDYPDRRLKKQNSWIRLREELDGNIELMLKKVSANEIGETFEQPVNVNDYMYAKNFLLAIGLEIKAEEESKRELWKLGDIEIMLDEWPWVKPYIEIEADSEDKVKALAKDLGLKWSDAKFGSIIPVYTDEYGITEEEFKKAEFTIKFDLPVPTKLKKLR